MVQALNLSVKSLIVLIAGQHLPFKPGWKLVVAVEVNITAYAHMLHAYESSGMVKVVENVFDCHRLAGAHQLAHAGDAHHAAGGCQFLDGLIALIARGRSPPPAIGIGAPPRTPP